MTDHADPIANPYEYAMNNPPGQTTEHLLRAVAEAWPDVDDLLELLQQRSLLERKVAMLKADAASELADGKTDASPPTPAPCDACTDADPWECGKDADDLAHLCGCECHGNPATPLPAPRAPLPPYIHWTAWDDLDLEGRDFFVDLDDVEELSWTGLWEWAANRPDGHTAPRLGEVCVFLPVGVHLSDANLEDTGHALAEVFFERTLLERVHEYEAETLDLDDLGEIFVRALAGPLRRYVAGLRGFYRPVCRVVLDDAFWARLAP